jgi:hypothetical protein
MSENTIYAFLDTNTVLHFKRPDLIDWKALVDAAKIFVVVTPVLVRELEQQKIHNRSRKLRERAQSILLWLVNFVDQENASEIRPQIYLLFIRHSPSIDFDVNKLSRSVSDDELIASALEFKSQHDVDVVISTADLGLRMKLPAHGLTGMAPNESDRLPDEPDESEKELIHVRRELARYASRIPKLKLMFVGGKEFSEIVMIEPGPPSLPRLPRVQLMTYVEAPPDRESVVEYQQKFAAWAQQISCFFDCNLVIENAGTAEATNVSIDFSLPDFVSARASDNLPKQPTEPAFGAGWSDIPTVMPLSRQLQSRPPGKPYIGRDGSLSFVIPSLVHNRVLNLHRFYFKFVNHESICNFSVPFTITCREIIDPISGELNFVLPKMSLKPT